MTEQSNSFKENYSTLKEIAETLRTQQEPDIDALIPMVDKATAAYKHCKNRIDAVKKAFAEKMPDSEVSQRNNT
jgi:exodeoxyribonuclease VII small subunit